MFYHYKVLSKHLHEVYLRLCKSSNPGGKYCSVNESKLFYKNFENRLIYFFQNTFNFVLCGETLEIFRSIILAVEGASLVKVVNTDS